MNTALYMRYLHEFVKEALKNSDGTNAGIAGYLWEKKITGFLVQHKEEKQKALDEARKAFDEHRHWPVSIVVSQMGLDSKELGLKL